MALGAAWDLLKTTAGSLGVYEKTLPTTASALPTPRKDRTKVIFDIETYPEFDLDLTAKHQIQVDYSSIEKRVLAHMMTTYETMTGTTNVITKDLSIEDVMEALKKVSDVDVSVVHPYGFFDFPVYDPSRYTTFY